MAEQVNKVVLNHGLTLFQHWDDSFPQYDRAKQCGATTWYQAVEDQLVYDSLEFWNRGDGKNAFLSSVELHVYSYFLALPQPGQYAYTEMSSAGKPKIHVWNFLPDEAKQCGALSHEFGHAYHEWTKVFSAAALKGDFWDLLARQFTVDKVAYDAGKYPWKQPDGQDQNPYENFAGLWRFFKGTMSERGSSGSGTDDPVVPGFVDPKARPDLGKLFDLLPETAAFIEAYGLLPWSLKWVVGDGSHPYFQFQLPDGTFIAHQWYWRQYRVWFKWTNAGWLQFNPSYVRA